MRVHLVDVARNLAVHPRDLAKAVDQGNLECWHLAGGPHINPDQAASLDLPAWRWSTLPEWAKANGTYYRQARNMLAAHLIDGIDDGPHRRWILQPVEPPPDPT